MLCLRCTRAVLELGLCSIDKAEVLYRCRDRQRRCCATADPTRPQQSPAIIAVFHQVENVGKVTFELFWKTAPRTCENFRALCTGERGKSSSGLSLSYLGCMFHRIIPGFMIQVSLPLTVGGDCSAFAESLPGRCVVHGTFAAAGRGHSKRGWYGRRIDLRQDVHGRRSVGTYFVCCYAYRT